MAGGSAIPEPTSLVLFSLDVILLVGRRRAVGKEVELSVLLQDSTIAGLADTLERSVPSTTAKRASEIVTLNTGPSERVLYLVHPLGGELLAYRTLARAIKAPLRILGLRWRQAGFTGASINTR